MFLPKFLIGVFPLHSIGVAMKKITVKIDAEGFMTLPEELRKELGDYITLKKTPQGYLMLPAKTRGP